MVLRSVALKYMAQFDVVRFNDFPSLKRLLWCGEVLPAPTLILLDAALAGSRFHKTCTVPTETTIASSYYTVPSCPENENSQIPIGKACEGEQLLVLDESLQTGFRRSCRRLVYRWGWAESGYWRAPEKTKSVFLDHTQHGRIYKTVIWRELAKTA